MLDVCTLSRLPSRIRLEDWSPLPVLLDRAAGSRSLRRLDLSAMISAERARRHINNTINDASSWRDVALNLEVHARTLQT